MSRINCHSAFKHYEMFHSRGGDVINIGSNNTTIFNMGAGFGGGSFWSGLGYGLGNGLGSIFGGLFGGNMGGFGNFGFGMSPWAGMGMFYNSMGAGGYGGSNRVDSHSDGKGKVKNDNEDKHAECKDPDLKKINKFRDDVQDIQGLDKPDKAKVKAKYDEIVKAKKDQDDTHKAENTAAYDNLLEDLQKLADKNGWGKLDDKDFGIDKPVTKPETKVDGADNKGKVAPADKTGNVKDDAAVGSTKFDDKLKEAGNDRNKLLALINDSSLTPEERAKAKAKYAETFGYTNYDGNDTINKDNMKLVTDTGLGSKADITTYVDVKQKVGSHPTEITMQTKYSKTKVTYKYVGVVHGEYIYESQSGKGQQYALQKNSNGYALVEYPYHKGFHDPDVK